MPEANKERIGAVPASYMELEGAEKDGDCRIVEVLGGISQKLGCCNLFDPEKDAQVFSCGTCEYVEGKAPTENEPMRNPPPWLAEKR
jgi:hypothetical protein